MRAPAAAVVASALLAAALGLVFAWGGREFCLDDAYIHLSYALSLKLGQGFSYNPYDFETGSSSPLWALLLWAWPWGPAPVGSVKLLGIVLHAAGAALACMLAMRITREHDATTTARSSIAGLAAGIFAASEPSLLQSATSGMEVSLTSALIVLVALLAAQERWRAAGVIAALATWARPETLFFACTLSAARWLATRRRATLAPALGAATAQIAWIAYCFALSGYPWPNTKYAKAVGLDFSGLPYLAAEVLIQRPIIFGVGGVVLAGYAMSRSKGNQRSLVAAIFVAWIATLLATALSRPYTPGVLFYYSRYFAIVAALPGVVAAAGLVHVRRAAALACVIPVAIATAFLARETLAQQQAQENDVLLLHTAPARYIAASLPRNAVVVSEGAGASRFFTPRSMTIVDMLGLNSRAVVHAAGDRQRLCAVLARKPTHMLVPDFLLGITVPLNVQLQRTFVDPAYAQSRQVRRQIVQLFAVSGLKARWRDLCPGHG